MSKDIYFNNRIFTNVPADELILDYISRMHDKGLRYDTMGSYEVLNAPVDWIDGKEVSGLWEFAPSHPDNKVIYARAIKHYKSDAKTPLPASSGDTKLDKFKQDKRANTIPFDAMYVEPSSGEKEEQEVKDEWGKEKEFYLDMEYRFSVFLCDATGGRMSKTNYDTDTMRRVMQDYQQESHYETIKTDILEMIKDGADLKEVIEYVKSL